MDLFEHYDFDPLETEVPSYPFFELWGIAWDARAILAGLTQNEIRSIGYSVVDCVFETKQIYVELDLEEHVERIIKNESWELRHLPDGQQVTPSSVRRLLENWPNDADENPFSATDDDLSDVEAFRMAVHCGNYPFGEEFHASSPAIGAAVLTLQIVASCVHTLHCPEDELGIGPEGPIASRLMAAANDAIEAASALGLAKEFAAEVVVQADVDMDEQELFRQHESTFNKTRARNAAVQRHSATTAAKHYVKNEWHVNGSAYSFNKSDFARTYVKLVAQNFRDRRGDPLTITEKTIREIWLAHTPAASKQAG